MADKEPHLTFQIHIQRYKKRIPMQVTDVSTSFPSQGAYLVKFRTMVALFIKDKGKWSVLSKPIVSSGLAAVITLEIQAVTTVRSHLKMAHFNPGIELDNGNLFRMDGKQSILLSKN